MRPAFPNLSGALSVFLPSSIHTQSIQTSLPDCPLFAVPKRHNDGQNAVHQNFYALLHALYKFG
ncbi:hypothetical protein R7P79_25675, partial [Vibrio sp. 2128(2023)]|uniref:hypothetical protein n=1 Tax=Vibrio sp. 2128(2023) TaxID=3074714 RepID=UPI002965187D